MMWIVIWFLSFMFGFWFGIVYGYYIACKDHNITDISVKK